MKTSKDTPPALPEGVTAEDLKYPDTWDRKTNKPTPKSEHTVRELGDHGQLSFYHVTSLGWCIATLPIAGSVRGQPPRTYAIRVDDGSTVRIGQGPHVTRTVTVYIRASRAEALKKFTDLYASGAVRSNEIRDRISSRRAQGQEMRAQGRHSWRWDV